MDAGDLSSESKLQPGLPLSCQLPGHYFLKTSCQEQPATEPGRSLSLHFLQDPGSSATVTPGLPQPPRGQPRQPPGDGAHCPRQGQLGPRITDLSGFPSPALVKNIKRL